MHKIGEDITNMGGGMNFINCECITDVNGLPETNLIETREITGLNKYANSIFSGSFFNEFKNLPTDVSLVSDWDFTGDGTSVETISGERLAIYFTDGTNQITNKGINFTIDSSKRVGQIIIYGNQNATTQVWSNISIVLAGE